MSKFKKTNAQIYAKTATVLSPDTIYWKKLGVPTLVKEFGAIDYIDFSPVEPYLFAVTASVRVQIYNPITKLVVKNISKFQEGAHGGSFRKDGNLLVAGDDLGKVRLFDVSSKSILRFFNGHRAPVHRTFFNADGHHISSFSDDKTVRYWDIATEKELNKFEDHHTDYIRAGCTSPVSPNVVLSGGYDKKINMYDTRTNEKILSLDHGSPVESLLFLPSGGIFISAGGTSVNVYDALAGGRKIAQLSQHHKTITCLQLASDGKRLLSGSLDRHVKIYDIATYQVVHTIDNTNAVLSLGVSKNDDTLVTGMVDGLIAIHRRDTDKDKDDQEKSLSRRAKVRARYDNIFEAADEKISEFRHDRIEQFDRMLRQYEYSKALDSAMVPIVMGKTPEKTVALIKELIRRKGLDRALRKRTHAFLVKFINFVMRNIGDYRFTPALVDAANILLDVYEDEFEQFAGTDVGKMFMNLSRRLKKEEKIVNDFLEVQGLLEMISAAADVSLATSEEEVTENVLLEELQASVNAQEQAVINIE